MGRGILLVVAVCTFTSSLHNVTGLSLDSVASAKQAYMQHNKAKSNRTDTGEIMDVAGLGTTWLSPEPMAENMLMYDAYLNGTYAFGGVPDYLIGGQYWGPVPWPNAGTWQISYMPPVTIYICIPDWGGMGTFGGLPAELTAANGWTAEPTGSFRRLHHEDPSEPISVWSQAFTSGYGLSLTTNAQIVGGVVGVGVAAAPAPAVSSATGDPHLQNVHGERFDLMKPGNHVLINIPRGARAESAMLRVEAKARRLGGSCAEIYFQELNITGLWAEAKQAGGYRYDSQSGAKESPEWVTLGKVAVKVAYGRTQDGVHYLNCYVKHLGRAGFVVGGLLGEDDYQDAATPAARCEQQMALQRAAASVNGPSALSVATASVA